jgi:hypothetical protein
MSTTFPSSFILLYQQYTFLQHGSCTVLGILFCQNPDEETQKLHIGHHENLKSTVGHYNITYIELFNSFVHIIQLIVNQLGKKVFAFV